MRETMLPLLVDFESVIELPHTISFFIRKMRQIMSFDELPKPKRPPEVIWDNAKELEEWFDNIYQYDSKQSDSGTPQEASIFIADSEYEG